MCNETDTAFDERRARARGRATLRQALIAAPVNTDVFHAFDMVVCVTQKAINDQLTHLAKLGTIQTSLLIARQTAADFQYVYEVLSPGGTIPPNSDFINAEVLPQVVIAESGQNITFVLNFLSGTLSIGGATADMTGWSYGVIIDLGLFAISQQDIGTKVKVPANVEQQLTAFLSSNFTVSSLFMDFESTDLVRYDPLHTNTGSAGGPALDAMVLFMQDYLTFIQKSGSPYILGYSIGTTDQTAYATDEDVPDSMRPVGTDFTMYNNPNNPDLSNLNFVLVTKGGQGTITQAAPTFTANWISSDEQCDAKLIYSHTCVVEKYILRPFFDQISASVFGQINGKINVGPGNAYDAAVTATPTGFSYTISDIADGDDQYVNQFSVVITNDPTSGTATLAFSGHLAFYKEVSQNDFFCTAHAWASASTDWSATIQMVSQKDAQGNPTLVITQSPPVLANTQSDSGMNSCAEGMGIFGKILGGILDVLTGFLDGGFFSNLLGDLFSVSIPGIGALAVMFGNLGESAANVLLLPAGDVFFFKSPAVDPLANLAMELTYKTPTQLAGRA